MNEELSAHCRMIAKYMREGSVVPFLGAGVNLYGRPHDAVFESGRYLPSAGELAVYLADRFDYPSVDERDRTDLLRVSQYVSFVGGSAELYDKLHDVFDADYPPTSLHRSLARLPATLRRERVGRYQLIVTTNYDDALERAFDEADEPYDVLTYIADSDNRPDQVGKFWHIPPGESARIIETPNEYHELSVEHRTVIAKIHGAIDRRDRGERDSFVITEDHYIHYLTRTDISEIMPVNLAATANQSHFLFLGYRLRDWNLRVILHRIWGRQRLKWSSWAVQKDSDAIERELWARRGVQVFHADLEDYVEALARALDDPVTLEVSR